MPDNPNPFSMSAKDVLLARMCLQAHAHAAAVEEMLKRVATKLDPEFDAQAFSSQIQAFRKAHEEHLRLAIGDKLPEAADQIFPEPPPE